MAARDTHPHAEEHTSDCLDRMDDPSNTWGACSCDSPDWESASTDWSRWDEQNQTEEV